MGAEGGVHAEFSALEEDPNAEVLERTEALERVDRPDSSLPETLVLAA